MALFGEFTSATIARMTITEAAAALDIPPGILRRAIRKSGLRWKLTKTKGEYVLTDADLEAICDHLRRNRRYKDLAPTSAQRDDDGTPGLPLEWLNDPSHTAEFVAERFRREDRLMTRVRACTARAVC